MNTHGVFFSSESGNTRLEALKNKHLEYKNRIREARKNPSTTDFYLNQLKKQKLLIKDLLEIEVANQVRHRESAV